MKIFTIAPAIAPLANFPPPITEAVPPTAAAYPAEDPGRLKTPEEILGAYLYLLGPDSLGVTGQTFDARG